MAQATSMFALKSSCHSIWNIVVFLGMEYAASRSWIYCQTLYFLLIGGIKRNSNLFFILDEISWYNLPIFIGFISHFWIQYSYQGPQSTWNFVLMWFDWHCVGGTPGQSKVTWNNQIVIQYNTITVQRVRVFSMTLGKCKCILFSIFYDDKLLYAPPSW